MTLCQNICKRLFCCRSSAEGRSYWDTDKAIMLIHALAASKLNDRNFCFFKWFGITSRMPPPTGKYSNTAISGFLKACFSAVLGSNWCLNCSVSPKVEKHHCLVKWWGLKARASEGFLIKRVFSIKNIYARVTESGRVQAIPLVCYIYYVKLA